MFDEKEPCSECMGATIIFRGQKNNTEYKICSQWEKPGHKSEDEIRQIITRVRRAANPSGRFA